MLEGEEEQHLEEEKVESLSKIRGKAKMDVPT